MDNLLKFFVSFFFVLGSFVPVKAIEGKLTAQLSKQKVGVGEQFQIVFSLNGRGDNFKAPSFSEFNFLGGPSQSTSMQIINGSMSQSVSFTYYLSGKKEGYYTIGSASIICEGKKVESAPLKIEVVKGNPNQQQQGGMGSQRSQRGNSHTGGQVTEKELADNIFMRTNISKTKVYQGEQVLVTYKLYRRLDVMQYQVNDMPKYNGFWKEDVKTDNQNYSENIDGIQYAVTEIKRSILIPQRSGSLEIDPLDITCLVRIKGRKQNSIFDDFFGFGGYQDINFNVKGKSTKIEVLPLPSNKPSYFDGAVGNFSLSAKADKNKLKSNEAVSLKLTISGKGNIKLVDPFELKLPNEIETYEPKTLDNISITSSGISGSRTFEYLLIPRHSGQYSIPSVNFSYFDTETKTYKTLSTNPIDIDVDKGSDDEKESANIVSNAAKEDVVAIGNDIRYIKSSTELKPQSTPFFNSALFYVLLILPIAGTLFFTLFKEKIIPSNTNAAEYKMKKAASIAQKHLSVAQQYLTNQKQDAFYNETLKAVNGYLNDRLRIPTSGLNKSSINEILAQKKIPAEVINQLLSIIDQCEFARFSPDGSQSAKENIYSETLAVIEKIENNLKA